jgi:general secretion pathway protein K
MSLLRPDRRQRGLALVVVLWVVALVALQVSLFNLTVRDAAALSGNELAILRGEALATAGVEIAVSRLLERDPERRWTADGSSHEVPFGGANLTIVVADEAGRIDINEADAELLASLMRPYARRLNDVRQWADRIMDWRDADSERRPDGAEELDYQRARMPYGPSNGPFLDVTELARVLGLPREAARDLAGILTVHGGDGKVNPLLASREVLAMLPGANAADVDRALELRRQGGPAAQNMASALAASRNWLGNRRGPAYRIEVSVRGVDVPATGSVEALVLVGRDAEAPYRTLRWRYDPGMWSRQAEDGRR